MSHLAFLSLTIALGFGAVSLAEDVVYDSLCITSGEFYNGVLNICGGEASWGISYDVQAADDMMLGQAYFITRMAADFVSGQALTPESLCFSVYGESIGSCLADNDARASGRVTAEDLVVEAFEDRVFGLEGTRVWSVMKFPPLLTRGTWWVAQQPTGAFGAFQVYYPGGYLECLTEECSMRMRDGGDRNNCCDGTGAYGRADWFSSDQFEPDTLSMRVEGIPAGDCNGDEQVSAQCKQRGGGGGFNLVVKVRNGQVNGTVTALLDPPDPSDISIPLDDRGRGKGKFKLVPAGDHRVFVCDPIVDVICSP